MSTNLLIIVSTALVLIGQGITIYAVRHLLRKWCVEVFQSGYRGGQEASEPFKEAYRLGFDIGYERGRSDHVDPEDMDVSELREQAQRLVQAIDSRIERRSHGVIEFEDAVIELSDDSPYDDRD